LRRVAESVGAGLLPPPPCLATSLRTSCSPCANWHSSPLRQVPFSLKFLQISVLNLGLTHPPPLLPAVCWRATIACTCATSDEATPCTVKDPNLLSRVQTSGRERSSASRVGKLRAR